MRMRVWGSLVGAVWCAGCAAQPAAPLVNAVAPGQVRITVTRETPPGPPVIIDDINGGHVAETAAALIDVNDAHVADLQPGQSYVGGVPPGPTSVTATGTGEPGHYVVKFNAVAGKTYAFQVSPRADASRKAALIAGSLAGPVGVLAGAAMEASAKGEAGGPFKLTQVGP
jgi:hypothetical protein